MREAEVGEDRKREDKDEKREEDKGVREEEKCCRSQLEWEREKKIQIREEGEIF